MSISELLTKIGIAKDNMEAAEKEFKAFLDGSYVPKARFNEVNEEKKTLQATVSDRDKQLEELKKTSGDTAALNKKIEQLQADNKKAKEESEAKIKEMQLTNAIKLAIVGKVHDEDIVSGLFDRSKLILSEDGKVTGLEEQLKTIEKNKPFLFKDSKGGGYEPNAGKGNTGKNPFAKDSFNLTEQGKLFTTNPEEARRLAAEAGVTI